MTRFRTANRVFDAYGREADVDVLEVVARSVVYFFAQSSINRNTLGRVGWLDRVRPALIDDHDRAVYLGAYDGDAESL